LQEYLLRYSEEKMLTVKNEEELLEILKSVCEGATSKAKSSLEELKDPAVEKYVAQYKEDEKALGSLSEQEDDAAEEEASAPAPDPTPEEDEATEDFGALDYYDRLDDGERKVLLLFLNSFADILTGEVQGSAAADPSEPPYSVKISTGEEPEAAPEPPRQEDEPEDEEDDTEGEEDTSPPIKVNESQDIAALREKIRLLIS
jgi:hypothetical protein